MSRPLKIAVVLGSYREGRQSLRVGRFIEAQIARRGHTALWVDPKEHNIPMLTARYSMLPPNTIPGLDGIAKKMDEADAYVLVSAEYNHAPPPGLTNILSYFYKKEYLGKVGGIVSYSMGSFGGVRAAVNLRPFLGEIGLVSIPYILAFPTVHRALNEDGTPVEEYPEKNAGEFMTQLEWYANALRAARDVKPL